MKLAGGAFGGKGLAARARAKVSKRNREKEAAAKKAAMETARRKQEDAAEADKARMLARANKGGGGGGGGGDDAGGGDGGGAGAEQTPGPVGDTVSLDHETREIADGVKVGDPMAVKGRPASSTKAVAKRKLQRADSKSGMTLSRKSMWIDLKVIIPPPSRPRAHSPASPGHQSLSSPRHPRLPRLPPSDPVSHLRPLLPPPTLLRTSRSARRWGGSPTATSSTAPARTTTSRTSSRLPRTCAARRWPRSAPSSR